MSGDNNTPFPEVWNWANEIMFHTHYLYIVWMICFLPHNLWQNTKTEVWAMTEGGEGEKHLDYRLWVRTSWCPIANRCWHSWSVVGNVYELRSGLATTRTTHGWTVLGKLLCEEHINISSSMQNSMDVQDTSITEFWDFDAISTNKPGSYKPRKEMELAALSHF